MTQNEIILEGYRYTGRFVIEKNSNTFRERVDTEVGFYHTNRTYTHFTGEGMVTDKRTAHESRFLIYPQGNDESHLVVLERGLRERIHDYKAVVDLALERMRDDAAKSQDIIPKVWPVSFNLATLTENGLVSTLEGTTVSLA